MTTLVEKEELLGLNALSDMQVQIALNYELENMQDDRKEALEKAIELNPQSSYALEAFAIYLEIDGEDTEKAEEFYLKALEIDPNNKRILFNFGNFYEELNDYINMMKYYNLCAELQDSDAFLQMANYHLNVRKDKQAMLECYLKGIEYCEDDEVNNTSTDSNDYSSRKYKDFNSFELQDILESIQDPTQKIINVLNKLKRKRDIFVYNNKVKLFERLHNVCDCNICLEDQKLNIDLYCGHEVCTDCYKKLYLDKCPWCRIKVSIKSSLK